MFGRNSDKKTRGQEPDPGRSNGHLIDLRQVVKTYESDAGVFVALDGIDLQVKAGRFVSIIGKSGSGKSTLLNMVTGIDKPTAGQVLVNGTAVHTLSEEKIAIWRGGNVGVIFQFFQLLPTLTAVENVLLAMDYGNIYPPRERPERAMYLLEVVGMADEAHKLPPTLSGGQQQSIAVARALANDPAILTADEPTGNLDSKTAELILDLFDDLVDRGKTILMVTHDKTLARRAQSTIVLSDGRILERQTNGSGLKVSGGTHVRAPV
jgi:putative ABC transport system ATP-binding protein